MKKNIFLLVASIIISIPASIFFGLLYLIFFKSIGGGSFLVPSSAASQIIGIPIAYIFFLTLFFTIFGGIKKYWWIGILLLPAVLFEVYFDWVHLYFPVVIGLVGWGLGLLVEKGIQKFKK